MTTTSSLENPSMLATIPMNPVPIMTLPPVQHSQDPLDPELVGQRQFKRHKVLPRPQDDRDQDVPRTLSGQHDLALDTSQKDSSPSETSSPRTLKHHSRMSSAGPDLPPTPPVQSRASSSSHSAVPSSPTISDARLHKSDDPPPRAPVTPPDPTSPPTPDVTPPQPANRPKAIRPSLGDRGGSRNTTMDSRTESFKTAREEPFSDEEDSRSTVRGATASGRTSQATVRRVSDGNSAIPHSQALGLALARVTRSSEQSQGSRSRSDFGQLEGEWGSAGEVEQEWDENLQRTVTVKKREQGQRSRNSRQPQAVTDDRVATQTDATRAVRHMALHENIPLDKPSEPTSARRSKVSATSRGEMPISKGKPRYAAPPAKSDATLSSKGRPRSATTPVMSNSIPNSKDKPRSHATSVNSDPSPVIEAILVNANGPPRRQQTLRHVRKQRTLRDSSESSPNSTVNSLGSERATKLQPQVLAVERRVPEPRAVRSQSAETRAAEPRVAESRTVKLRPATETEAAETRSVKEPRSAKPRPAEPRAVKPRAVESRIPEPLGAEPRPTESRAVKAQPAEVKVAEPQTVKPQTVDTQPTESRTAEARAARPRSEERRSVESRPVELRPLDRRADSFASYTTTGSLSSNRTRREIWKNGAIPVVVIPDRRSSTRSKSSREPSLRSTSSRRSGRANSIGSAPLVEYIDSDMVPVFERRSRHSRRYSESDGRDQRTMDYPPVVPARSSSLSAPTSRNTSRAGSMTADSIKARNALQQRQGSQPRETASTAPMVIQAKDTDLVRRRKSGGHELPPQSVSSPDPAKEEPRSTNYPVIVSASEKDEAHEKLSLDHHDDALSSKKYSSRNTPFSTASIETNGTAPEVSEALAVQMYPHQNSSLLMVNHSAKPSDGSDTTPKKVQGPASQPKITTTAPDEEEPMTPPQPHFHLEEVDSPLRNPRSPPEPPAHPPAINFIPATPSGLTPAHDKAVQMGNYFETMGEKPSRRPSLVKRALNRRRRLSLEYPPSASRSAGFLTRTLSLSRSIRRNSGAFLAQSKPDMEGHMTYPQVEDRPAEEDKLHPFWRPLWSDDVFDDFDGEGAGDRDDDVVYRYPPIDNRPRLPKRSLSERMKRTFAIFPIADDDFYPVDNSQGPERRTIRRTPSGNLRVVRHSLSAESMQRRRSQFRKSLTGQSGEIFRGVSNVQGVHRRRSKERRRSFSIGATLEEIQNIPRRLSDKRRERRSEELRSKISGPREVRDGVEDMLRSSSTRERRSADGDV